MRWGEDANLSLVVAGSNPTEDVDFFLFSFLFFFVSPLSVISTHT